MSHLLNFISSFGSSAELRQLPVAELTSRMQQAGLTPTEIAVLHSGDHKAIPFDAISRQSGVHDRDAGNPG